ncbi:sensor histidine kinase [Lewinella sp. IMCC34191]|uniref:sensor histidine kinase n=1 Tax=Lewinella sp. IMCC34191 TaxID=2259172 RepID=UPI000E2393B8|nr:histidine kinase [Lewinella sp. IMCC34191]
MLLSREERIRYLGFDDHWAMALGIPFLAGLAAVLFIAGREGSDYNWSVCLSFSFMHTLIYWVINRRVVVYLRRRYPGEKDTPRRIQLMTAFSVTFALAVESVLNSLVFPRLDWLVGAGYGAAPLSFEVTVATTLCLMVLAIYESIYFFTRYRQSLLEQERLMRTDVQAQLETLKQQVNPHFLFNSLNTLVQVIPEDTDKAVLFTQRLSAVYRRILEYRHRDLITLEEELEALKDYVFLMKTRFEDKLLVTYSGGGAQVKSLPDNFEESVFLVPLSLQLLVENAIKHNVVSEDHPLRIEIILTAEAVNVVNNLQPRSRRKNSTGWGQDNLRQRYRLAGGAQATVAVTSTHYRVTLPLLRLENTPEYATA